MKTSRRAIFALAIASLGAAACAQLIGWDDTRDRLATNALGDAGDAGGETTPGDSCTKNVECINRTLARSPALCVQNQCVAVDLDLCLPQILPDPALLENDNVLLIAGFVPRLGAIAPLQQAHSLAFDLALAELNDAKGIPTTPRRDFAMVVCANEPTLAKSAVTHVVTKLRVPAIIAGFGSDELTEYVRDITRENGVFVLNPSVAPEALKYEKDEKGLFWSLLGPVEEVALAYRPLVEDMTRYVKTVRRPQGDGGTTDGGAADGGAHVIKVALINTKTADERAAATTVRFGSYVDGQLERDAAAAIEVNGLTPERAREVGTFRSDEVESIELSKIAPSATLIEDLAAYRPDIVIAITAQETDIIVPRVEDRIANAYGIANLPIWLLGQRNASRADLMAYMTSGTHDEPAEARMKRFLGIQFASSTTPKEKDAWLGRMDLRHKTGATRPTDYSASENFYDAVYWIAYGLFAGKSSTVGLPDGEAIGRGVRQLLSGTAVRPGERAKIDEAFRLLAFGNGQHAFVGALGPPDIDPRFGTWRSVGATYCYEKTDAGVAAPRYDVQRFQPNSGTLEDVKDDEEQKRICNVY